MDVARIVADLVAEQEALDRVVTRLTAQRWAAGTPSAGWTVADQIGHLSYFDGTAALAITDPDRFRASLAELAGGGPAVAAITLGRGVEPAELLARWRDNRAALAAAASGLAEDRRIPWYGPSMSSRSFLTARLMECWAHGQDVVDALGATRPASDRLHHIARLGFITRAWSYRNRGVEPPEVSARLELAAPSGAAWRFGPDDAAEVVTGPAEDFCLVVTQRRHVDDTDLVASGPAAREWLGLAQCFAGPPTDPPAPRR